jgi:hypothetical protein
VKLIRQLLKQNISFIMCTLWRFLGFWGLDNGLSGFLVLPRLLKRLLISGWDYAAS